MLGLVARGGSDPTRSLGTIAVFAVLVGFSSATQDIAIDAWRIEAAETSQAGRDGGRVSVGLPRRDHRRRRGAAAARRRYGWNFSYAVMAALMMVGVLAVLAAPREERHAIRPIAHRGHPRRAGARGGRVGVAARCPRGRRARAGLGPGGQCGGPRARARRRSALARRATRCSRPGSRTRASGCTSPRCVAGFGVDRRWPRRRFPARARGPASTSPRRWPIRCATSSRATAAHGRADPRADLPLSHPRLRAQHHESRSISTSATRWSRSPRCGRSSAS